ncbi:MAG: ribosome biogenesis protein [Nitrososphaerota archaeon]
MVKRFVLVIAETSLELVPPSMFQHPTVIHDARRRGLDVSELLLDRSYHYMAMKGLQQEYKRGRPDIAYHILLDVTASPIYKKGLLKLYMHTIDNHVIDVSYGLRPPRTYVRYEGLIRELFKKKSLANGLLKLFDADFSKMLELFQHDIVVGFSRMGNHTSMGCVIKQYSVYNVPVFVVGGFPRGHFSDEIKKEISTLYCISDYALDASTVVNRFLCEAEHNINI